MIEFLWSLLAIVMIDVVLGGENAIVIAMASKNLPAELRKKAMLYGTLGAVGVRFACVAGLTYLLMIPGLRLVGGVALLWIAYKLVTDNGEHDEVAAAPTLMGALKTIVIADAVMGVDNALGIAAAAGGNWTLIIFGLLISVPIVLYGSTVVAGFLEKYPKLIWVGGGILVIVALKMMYDDPLPAQLWDTYFVKPLTITLPATQ